MVTDKSKQERLRTIIHKLRKEIIELEREVGEQCETIQSLQSELKLLRKESPCPRRGWKSGA
jgi:predicted RNase H-like nuclease (RuvC/YqgF family)